MYFKSADVLGRRIHANAEGDSEELANPPKVEDKLGAVPNGLSTDSDVVKRLIGHLISLQNFLLVDSDFVFGFLISCVHYWV